MFTKPTVIILGAGASWHYGYPTGEDLVKKVIEKASSLLSYLDWVTTNPVPNMNLWPNFLPPTTDEATTTQGMHASWHTAHAQCSALKAGLEQVNPLVIDYYLGWNPKLQAIGKLLIAWVILECEYLYHRNKGNINRKELVINSPNKAERINARELDLGKYKDDWCRFIIHQLAINCKTSADLLGNEIHFITLNYDISLERALYNGLRHIDMLAPDDIETFLSGDRVIHVYGRVHENSRESLPDLKWSEQSRDLKGVGVGRGQEQVLLNYKTFFDYIYNSSQGIHVIDPDDKETNDDKIKTATEEIGKAEYVYILGYGFDTNNSDRLRLPMALHYQRAKGKFVFFTNFRDINRVTKRASEVCFGNSGGFAPGQLIKIAASTLYERSLRDVYEALELDFDWFH
jgi:hypothetical protein